MLQKYLESSYFKNITVLMCGKNKLENAILPSAVISANHAKYFDIRSGNPITGLDRP
jgi:hypothetical protein